MTGTSAVASALLHMEDPRCLDLLRGALEANRGLTSAALDRTTNHITLTYRADQTSEESVRRVGAHLNDLFGTRYRRCRTDPDRQACEECALASQRAVEVVESFAYDISDLRLTVARSPSSANDSSQTFAVDTPAPDAPRGARRREFWRRHHLALWSLLAGVSILAAWISDSAGFLIASRLLYVIGYLSGGWLAAKESFDGLRDKRLDVNFLMTFAAVGAAFLDRWTEGGTLIFLFSLSNTLEHYALEKTKSAVKALMDLRPAEARLVTASGPLRVSVEDLSIGDRILIRPGEKIPADGAITEGETTVDRSTFTGESLPVERRVADTVLAGTLNLTGQITVAVNRRADDTALAGIVHRVEEAQSGKTPSHDFVRWFGQRYTIGVLVGAVFATVIPPLLFGVEWSVAIYRSLTLLVVASPCALIISTPAAVLSAIGRAALRGVLFKGGRHLVELGQVRAVAFDKTGTLTQGRAVVTDVTALDQTGADELVKLAAAVESGSTHPLAAAVLDEAERRALVIPSVSGAQTIAGQGVTGTVRGDGEVPRAIIVGNRRLMAAHRIVIDAKTTKLLERLEHEGKTAVLVASECVLGILAIADPPRPRAAEMISALHASGIVSVSILTGDHHRVAEAMAKRLGIDDVRADLQPGEKADAVGELLARHRSVAVVGDGINDAPALASASVGIAMGGAGNDVVLETADVVLIADDLARLPFAIGLARRANRIIVQNLTFSLVVIAALLVGTFLDQIPLTLGVVGHEGSTLLVVLNSLRLLWHK